MREIPPTAGLPLAWRDLLPAPRGDFCAAAQAFVGAPHGGLACSGTAALVVMLSALHRLSGRRRVLIPAYTCPLVPLAIAHCGLEAVPCDLARGDFAPAAAHYIERFDADTLAVLPTHLVGRVSEVGALLPAAHARGIYVIEDAAQAFGARIGGESVGLTGDAGFFSFAAGKGLSIFEGGMWVSRDAQLAAAFEAAARDVLRPSWRWSLQRAVELVGYWALYRPRTLGPVYGRPLRRALARGDLAEAVGDVFSPELPLHSLGRWRQAVGRAALERLPAFEQALRAQALARLEALRALPGLQVFDDMPDAQGVWPSLLVCLPDEATRDRAMAQLWGAGLGVTRMFVHALPDYAYLRPFLAAADCPVAADFAARSLTISNSPWLGEADFARILTLLAHAMR